ncbi:putative Phenylalanine racemase (ATP-hydrolyzing) [Candidatus Sulfotelmatobacter kueseliae]|uniref:Putative Phenylalanine racemase (ATP-hydrolyzing) n=1 Tax=Candidatus Sulfotelmatobacter kueseliae TaxID=2042962 RepID=A0A2U3KKL8_9BACT|nr:putative Phenylalanine racemase (ATP-hydrolyzing) [Candidatus Sulfotelmatobacter kueseliae]
MKLRSDVEEIAVRDGGSTAPSKTSGPGHGKLTRGVARTFAPLRRGPHELIEEQAERTPDAPALSLGAERISYRELNSRSNRLAHFLRQQGVGPESVVGVYLDRSFASVVSLFAILKSGGTYLPLDPKFPNDRLAFMLADSAVPLLLTHSSKRGSLPETAARVISLDVENQSIAGLPATNLASSGKPEHLAYLIYTSGSTGKPKGVMIQRRALVNFLLSMAETPGIASSDRLLAVTTSSFDISLLEFLLPLVCGAEIVLATAEQAADARELQTLLHQHAITVMQATPATWRMLLENGWEGKSDLRVFCGGEALTADIARQLLPRCRELWNMYGPTETTIWSSTERVTSPDLVSLGTPIANTQFHLLDENHKPVSQGTPGELWIGGAGLARGYLNPPEWTAERFVLDPTREGRGERLYRTGDQVRYRPDGSLEFLGRLDNQVKLHGFRIELGEIESSLAKVEGIAQAVVILREDRPGEKRLAAYYTGREGLSSTSLVQFLKTTLPDYMIPSVFVRLEKFPLTPNAKIDRKALPRPEGKRPLLAQEFIAPRTAAERQLASLWCELLQLEEVGIDDSFFDLGGNSLAAVRMVNQYHTRFGREIPPVKVFQYPTIAKLAEFLEESESKSDLVAEAEERARHRRNPQPKSERNPATEDGLLREGVAVIGMTGRFPGAANLDQLWRNLCNAVESISFFTPEELGPGIDPHLRRDPDYIRARGLIEGADLFDAAFFGINPLEAKVMDPQQRIFLELAQQALENAGYDPERYKGRIGVFAGIGDNHYYTTNLLTQPDLLAMAGKLAVEYGNQKDYIALRTAYLLDLRGPAVSLNTACSTTLLTIDEAYHSLLDYECDIALSGGIDITVPQRSGFLYQQGGTFSKDGHCRPFDADATGTMFCDGAGVVVLKRYAEALADGDTIYAVIRGTGKNNNGARPASFLAPSVDGQAEAIALAQANANVPVETIGYIEAHGTGTPVGDPIEFEALRRVFENKTDKKNFCYIGSIKGNIGHPTNAAGVAGLIKAALVLHREQIPPTLHFKTPNPKIDFGGSPFLMADKLIPFPRGKGVRRTAVSSFGFGGTNVHVILEEAPVAKSGRPSRPLQLLPLSAKSPAALDAYSRALAEHLASAPEDLADVAYTFQTGRKQLAQRRFVVAADSGDAAKLLLQPNPLRCGSKRCERRDPPIVFLFGGQGTQYVNMGLNLYRDEPLFRAVVDDCCECLKPHLGRDLRELLYPQSGDEETAQISLRDTFFTQPSIFVIEYALARFWQSLGVEPALMAGHSIGEFVAATLAGVWDLEDALSVVALRGRLMQELPRGSMMAVSSSAESVAKILPPGLQLASNNAPALCVVSGPEENIAQFRKQLEAENFVCRQLHTSHAFHSAMMDPMIEPLRQAVAKIRLRAPAKPFVSTVTGRSITAAETSNPAYWANHARATVEFSKAILCLKEQGHDFFLECGPRSTMCALARQHFTPDHPCTAIPTFADTAENNTEWATLLFALGSLWQNGVSIEWEGFYTNEERHRIPLPTYPFERQRFWVDPAEASTAQNPENRSSSAAAGVRVEPSTEPSVAPSALPSALTEAVTSGRGAGSRKDRIAARVIDLLLPVSGRERSQIDTSATFMEQGFDSLSLTQVAFAVQKEFSVKVSFSQLMKQFPNIDMLAAHLDSTLPAEALAEATPIPTANSLADVRTNAQPSIQSKGSTLEEAVVEQARTIARLVALLEKGGGNRIAAEDETPVVQKLSTDGSKPAIVRSSPRDIEATVPQRGIFSSSRLSERLSASYNESMTLRFTGKISVAKMMGAMERLVERHDALRTSFDETGRMMKIAPALKIAMPVTDLSMQVPANEPDWQEQRFRKLIADETALPFPLPAGPLFRCQMVLLGAERAAVIITAHHIICDGWSLDVLIHDLCAFYSEELSGAPVHLELADSYGDYVKNTTERERSAEFKQAGNYWHAKFHDGFPVLVLPTDHPRSARREFNARRLDHSISASVVRDLRALGAEHNCSFFAVLLSSLAILLARISRQHRFVITLPTAEQPSIGQPGLVGHCVNLLPFAVELREGEAAEAFLKRVQADLLAAHEHAIFTMVSLMEDLHPAAPTPGISPISVGLTNIKKFKQNELPQFGFAVDYEANPKAFESFELYLNVVEAEENLALHCHYDIKLFADLTVREWLVTLGSIFEELAADPSRKVTQLARLKWSETASATEIVYKRIPNREMTRQSVSPALGSTPGAPQQFSDTPTISGMSEATLVQSLIPLWQRVLNGSEIGPDDDFFALGGHSVAAAQLFALIQSELGCTPPLAALYDAPTPRKLASVLGRGMKAEDGPSLGLARKDPGLRPFAVDDIPQVADLWWKFLRYGKGAPPSGLHSYFEELYFRSPLIDERTPSRVYEGKNGRIVGFLGVVRRKMSLRGRPLCIAVGGNFVVAPEARSSLAGLRLLTAYMAGEQDISLTDSANDISRSLLERMGFRTIMPLSMHWARPLRLTNYAAHAMSKLAGPTLSASLRIAARPFCSVVDAIGARLPFSPLRPIPSHLQAAELDVEVLLHCLAKFRSDHSILPDYEVDSLKWLLTFMERMHPRSELRKIVLRDDRQKVVGWYIYYPKIGDVAQAVQIGGESRFGKDILDHLFYDAWSQGAVGLHGTAPIHLMDALSQKNCFFTCGRGGWTIAHSRKPELLELLVRGDASLSRLDGEWCLNFDD